MKKILSISALFSVAALQGYGYDSSEFCVEAEALYWSMSDNFPLAVNVLMTNEDETVGDIDFASQFINVSLKKPQNNWEPGFRLGFKWTNCDCFDVKGIYTWYYNKSDTHEVGNLNEMGTLNGQWPFGEFIRSFNYNMGDLEIGKSFVFSYLVLRPFCGIRNAYLNQRHKARLTGYSETFTNNSGTVVVQEPLDYKVHQEVWGIGPRIGLDTAWGNFCGISLLANTSFSALYGRETFDLKVYTISGKLNNEIVKESLTDVDITHAFYQLIPAFQIFMGLSWNYEWRSNYGIRVKAGWESIIWWDTANILFFDKSVALQGVTAGLQFDF